TGTVGIAATAPSQGGIAVQSGQNPAQAMDRAFSAARHADYSVGEDMPAGVPQGRPPWIIPVIVGVVALFLGGGLAIVSALARCPPRALASHVAHWSPPR